MYLYISAVGNPMERSVLAATETRPLCLYTTQGGRTETVECNKGQSCYAIVSVTHRNNTWETTKNSLGCWENVSYCTENDCGIKLPNYIWVEHNFPRFCCCKGNLCNKRIALER